MSFKTDTSPYVHCQCPKCGKRQVLSSVELRARFMDARIRIAAWDYAWLGARMRCTKCGTKGVVLTAGGWS